MIKNIPNIGMGTWLVTDKQILKNTIKAGLESGYKHIDTAQIYNNEYQIGEVLKELNIDTDDIFITSKVFSTNFKHVKESIKESLKRLQIKKINLMLLHSNISNFDRDLNVQAFKDLLEARDEGLVDYAGVSNFMIQDLKDLKEATGEYPYINQIVLAPTVRDLELEKFCKDNNIKLTGYSTLKSYFNPNPYYPGSGMNDEEKKYIDILAKKYDKNVGQILNKWALSLGYSIIPKSEKVNRVISNFELDNFELTEEEMSKINYFNKFDSNKYKELVNGWINGLGGKEKFAQMLERGLLYDKNFDSI